MVTELGPLNSTVHEEGKASSRASASVVRKYSAGSQLSRRAAAAMAVTVTLTLVFGSGSHEAFASGGGPEPYTVGPSAGDTEATGAAEALGSAADVLDSVVPGTEVVVGAALAAGSLR